MKRIITLAGGQVLYVSTPFSVFSFADSGYARQTPSGATHILTSQHLNGSKTHKLLTGKAKVKPHVVRPEWVTESIKAGKRLVERHYSVIKDASVSSLVGMLSVPGSSSVNPIELA